MEIIWALASSLMFAGTFLLIKLGRETSTHLSVLWVTLTINVFILSLLNFFFVPSIDIDLREWQYFILAGLFAPLLGRLFQFIGMSALGTNVTTAITLTHPLVSVALGVFFLGETATYTQLEGAIAVMLGSFLIGISTQARSLKVPVLKTLFSFYAPILASLAYGVSIWFRKIGIENGTDPIVASAVSVITSWIVLTLYVVFFGIKISCNRRELSYFLTAGILSSAGPVFLYIALAAGALVVVAPLAATTPLFVLAGTWMYSRQNEIFNRHILVGVSSVVLGVTLLAGDFG
ncbi:MULTISPECIES: DMT family transporter [unclassified Marinobacterium]|jgi:drug/metabolite transporter (DMT)-like permease|uniref:DMT family transporter n=1 Tax=unclassified Marinobacterium TaxID=2644139 RepID=UPI0015692C26|nr:MULTISPECIES: DMT family transporter [unclassified Marinobacterium]NRP46587.1 EamA-like transporter family protein [Marinobacterium sp. xm-d-543]NRQ01314.1 EamA-like transporter family protein [Marinobacterium sp. xm-d-530]